MHIWSMYTYSHKLQEHNLGWNPVGNSRNFVRSNHMFFLSLRLACCECQKHGNGAEPQNEKYVIHKTYFNNLNSEVRNRKINTKNIRLFVNAIKFTMNQNW